MASVHVTKQHLSNLHSLDNVNILLAKINHDKPVEQ